MGCVSSKTDINDIHHNIFHVMNVDENYIAISPGEIEITETELVFHQRHKQPTKWSLRNLRKYGFDSDIFSFECGRRCATGPGIFAFRCRRAEQLFNLLQQNIQLRNMMMPHEDTALSELTIPQIHRRSTPEGYLNPVSTNGAMNSRPTLSRPGSVTSNGPVSPNSATVSLKEHNNNKRASLEHSYLNTGCESEDLAMAYVNIPSTIDPTSENSRLYMNITTNMELPINEIEIRSSDSIQPQEDEELTRNYANIDTNADLGNDTPLTPTVKEVNYIELDLVPSCNNVSNAANANNNSNNNDNNNQRQNTESPKKRKSYVTIDFNKTKALKESVNPRMELEDGSRKTRHNSTIGDPVVRHSSSISD